MRSDTDGDTISDYVEVLGFRYANQDWYPDPLSPDTNGDGRLDGLECAPLIELDAGTTDRPSITCDLDNDGILDRDGKRDKMPADVNPFNRDHPFSIKVTKLNQGHPVFLDLQLRPVNADHLAYAMNVLDWPADDTQGQVQRVKRTTFARSDNSEARSANDPRAKNGDMRLIPMLEIVIPSDEVEGVPRRFAGGAPVAHQHRRHRALRRWHSGDRFPALRRPTPGRGPHGAPRRLRRPRSRSTRL